MYNGLRIINCDPVLKKIQEFNCGKADIIFLDRSDFEIPYSDIEPLEGYNPPPGFPNCCNKHRNLFEIGVEKFSKFPNCCKAHKKLSTADWFNKEDYSYMPMKVVTSIAYTWHCISECIEKENWYKAITDYIDVVAHSFGQLPKGYGPPIGIELYLYNIERDLEEKKELPEAKRKSLIQFVRNWGKQDSKFEQADIQELIEVYRTWLKDFPFDLPFFSDLKEYFDKHIPILSGKRETNIYTGLTGFQLTTYENLITFLASTTEKIISEVNTLVLYEKGAITDIQKTQIDIINSSHRFNLKQLKESKAKGRNQYLQLIKNWFKCEKQYLNELTSALAKPNLVKPDEPKQKNPIKAPIITLFCFLVQESELIVRIPHESVASFCKRVCSEYKLPYTERVRHYFYGRENKRNIKKVKELILPLIDDPSKDHILKHLETKQQKRQKLYG